MDKALITVDELKNIKDSVVLLDASMPKPMRYICGARYFDVDSAADHNSPYPHMLPTSEAFGEYMSQLGVNNDDHIVIYDSTGVSFAAARAWWTLRTFGHEKVQVLNGGLPAWMQAGGETDTAPALADSTTSYNATFNPELYRSYDDMVSISESGNEQIIDTRGAGRFNAMARNIDGDIVPAHIEGSVNLPFAAVLDPMGGTMLADEILQGIFANYIPSHDTKRVVMCASGITACVVALAFFQTGERDVAVFDGSWIEWSDHEGIR